MLQQTPGRKLALATAVAAAFAVPMAVNATTATYTAQNVASNMFKLATQTIKNVSAYGIVATGSEVYLGRTTGFNVVLTLTNATFSGDPTLPTTGTALFANSAAQASGTSGDCKWTVSKAGGGSGTSSITYSVQPAGGGCSNGIVQGTLLTFGSGAITLAGVTALGTTGGTVSVSAQLNDPGAGGALGGAATTTLATSIQGVQTPVFGATTTTEKIDVASDATHGSKTFFSADGSIGKLDRATFLAGTFSVLANTTASCFGVSTGTANCLPGGGPGAGDTFGFNSASDTVSVTLTGTNLAAFRAAGASVFIASGTLDSGGACSGADTLVSATGGTSGSTNASILLAGVPLLGAGSAYSVCLKVPVSLGNVIANQSLGISVAVNFVNQTALTNPPPFAGTLAPLAYNGTVRDVYYFNPGTNTSQLSVIRIVNPTTTSGKVTITGIRDDATAGLGPVTLTLAANTAVQITAVDFEQGNGTLAGGTMAGSLGSGNGLKWHLTLTGEFSNMQVYNFLRNQPNVINTNNFSNSVDGSTTQNGPGPKIEEKKPEP